MEFNETAYLRNKARALNEQGYEGRNDWSVSSVRSAFRDNNLTPQQHYETFGRDEGISPIAQATRSSAERSSNMANQLSGSYQSTIDSLSSQIDNLRTQNRELEKVAMEPAMTVKAQLNKSLSEDSPLMQRAATRANQAANTRGLLNSSMAQQASQGAMTDRALEVAMTDASRYFENAQRNADRSNQDYMQRLGFEQGLVDTAARYNVDSSLLEQEGNQAMERLYGTSLANAWGVMGNNITDIVAESMVQVANVQNNPNINPEDKTRMIQQILDARDADVEFQSELYASLPQTLQDTGVFPVAG